MRLRVRSRTGVQTVTVDGTATFAALCQQLSASKISSGYPPKPIESSDDTPISTLFRDGEMLIVQAGAPNPAASTQTPTLSKTPTSTAPAKSQLLSSGVTRETNPTIDDSSSISSQGRMVVREVPDDNSCLFRCILNLTGQLNRPVSYFRKIISDEIMNNPEEYTSAVLGKEPMDYIAWVQSDHAWGGAIELSIFAKYFKVQFAAFDIHTKRLDRYAQDKNYDTVAFLLYDGIHYNYVALTIAEGIPDVTQFDPKDQVVVGKIESIVKKMHDNRQYTDTASFNIRCGQCGISLKGEKHALEHARATGHTQFDES